VLLGRERELAAVSDVCRAALEGHGSTLLVFGEPGIGKTALLASAVSAVAPARVLRATGVEAESAVAFAALQALLWPLRSRIEDVEPGQTALLRGVLELGPQVGTSTFAVGAAVLGLLSLSSGEEPIVLVLDDAQWADVPSQEVLSFVGRRLEHERIALLVGLREGEPSAFGEERSFGRLELAGLDDEAARSLLESAELAPPVAERLLEACGGNPLGLIELPAALSGAQRLGTEPLPAALEAGPLVQGAYSARASRLGAETQRALLLLAAAGESDAVLLATDALVEAEAAGLVVRSGARVDFRHPLMRAAVYGAADPAARRAAHLELAGAATGARRAWHLADAATRPDEAVAGALEAVALEARRMGGVAAQAQALERAAELTAEAGRRVMRLIEAARAWRLAGRAERVDELLAAALSLADSPRLRAEVELERGRSLVRELAGEASIDRLVLEAEAVETVEPKLASRLLVEAALYAEVTVGSPRTVELAEEARSLAGTDGDAAELAAVNMLLAARASAGTPPDERDAELLGRAVELLQRPELRTGTEEAHWVSYVLALHEHDDEARGLNDRALAEARAVGDVWSLCFGLYARAAIEQTTGRVDAASAFALEATGLADQIGEPWRRAEAAAVLGEVEAARGNLEACTRILEERIGLLPQPRPFGEAAELLPIGFALSACRDYARAIERLEPVVPVFRTGFPRAWYHLLPVELAEAYLGAGRARDAETLLREAAPGIESCMLVRPRAKLARVQSLLAPEAKIDASFAQALTLLEAVPQPFERARVELCWGERLRSAGRSDEAAPHLEHALAHFEALGAVGWSERARAELETATGSTRPAQPRRTDVLTPQELRVARHAAGGLRDREIAAALFLSPRTVESYLQSAYRKLDVSNRTQLTGVLAADGISPPESLSAG
jgi:DNA-binding CsgD family transcriptional regulator